MVNKKLITAAAKIISTKRNSKTSENNSLKTVGNAISSMFKESEQRRNTVRSTGKPRRKLDRPGKDEPKGDLLSGLQDFVDDADIQKEKSGKRKVSQSVFKKQLKWLHDIIDDATSKLRSTGNKIQTGRFYVSNYKARHGDILDVWDAQPVIFVLDAKYATHMYNKESRKPNIGVLGINLHWIPMKERRRIMKLLILMHPGNKANFKNNRALVMLPIIYELAKRHGAVRQYLRAGRYPDERGKMYEAGLFNTRQIPYSALTEVLQVPSIWGSNMVSN